MFEQNNEKKQELLSQFEITTKPLSFFEVVIEDQALLVVASQPQHEMFILHSMDRCIYTAKCGVLNVCRKIAAYFNIPTNNITVLPRIQQPFTDDCGVFVLINTRLLAEQFILQNGIAEAPSQQDCKRERRRLKSSTDLVQRAKQSKANPDVTNKQVAHHDLFENVTGSEVSITSNHPDANVEDNNDDDPYDAYDVFHNLNKGKKRGNRKTKPNAEAGIRYELFHIKTGFESVFDRARAT